MHDLAFERCIQRLGEGKSQDLHVLLVGLRVARRLGQAFGEEEMRATGQKGGAVHHAQRSIPRGDQAGLLRELTARAFERVLITVERPRRDLPRRRLPGVAPLADQHRVAVVE